MGAKRSVIRIGTSSRLGALVACMMVSAAAAGAQMSLSTVVDLALKHDPKMRAAQANVDKAMYALHEVEYAYIPSASVSGGYGKATGVPLGVPEVFTFQAQSLLFNFSQRDYIRAAEQGLKAAKLAAKDTHDQVAEDAVVSYLDLDHAQGRASAIAEEFAAANKLVTIVED
ncbi:MAG: TolC family protein, partial [Bryocella sp.]